MRTTIDIADDVLAAAKELARRERKTAGEVLSDLARRGLNGSAPSPERISDAEARLGIHPLPSRGGLVTNELVNRLREEDIY